MNAVTNEPPFPIIVGITGHREIAPGALEAAGTAVRAALVALQTHFGAALHVMTALAEGADQLVAGIAAELGIGLFAVSPMSLAVYRDTLQDPAARLALDRYWSSAVLRLILPELCEPADASFAERQFGQLGELLSRRSHLLLALWDGLNGDAAGAVGRSPGGTADVVQTRLGAERVQTRFPTSPLFAGAGSRLDLAPGGPVLHVVTARDGVPAAGPATCFLLQRAPDGTTGSRRIEPAGVFDALTGPMRNDFAHIAALNRQIVKLPPRRSASFHARIAGGFSLHDQGATSDAAAWLGRLRLQQAAADCAAQIFHHKLLGEWVPAVSLSAMWRRGWRRFRDTGRLPAIGVLFLFAASVPVAVTGFEIYTNIGYPPWALLLYLVPFGLSIAIYQFRVRRDDWQNHFQDYRALAEAMRVQLFWALSATPVAVADNYLRKQSGEMGWIQFALRGPALYAAALALSLDGPRRDLVVGGWMKDQRDFFLGTDLVQGKAALNRAAARNGEAWSRIFVVAGLGIALALALLEVGLWMAGYDAAGSGAPPAVGGLRKALVVVAAITPAMAAFFTVSSEKRAYEALAQTYELIGRIFARAIREAAAPDMRDDDREFQTLVLDLGREALAENAEWLLDHRHRPIQHKGT